MENVTIIAHSGTGDSKVKAGEKADSKPTTIDEAVSKWGETTLCKLAWESHVINVQREIRGGGNGGLKAKVALLIEQARTEAKEGDNTSLDQLIRLKVIER